MDIEITAQPIFWLPLTPRQIEVLKKLSESHYDWTCKSASRPGEGGFIHGWHVRIEYCESTEPRPLCKATWQELDLSLKIMEMSGWLPQDEKDIVSELRTAFYGALDEYKEAGRFWITEYRG
jgi:hypothetical protein